MNKEDFLLLRQVSKQTIVARVGQWARNIVANEKLIRKSKGIIELFDKYKGKNYPAIIVSSGPSLDKNIKYLKHIKDKAIIVAVDSSFSALLNVGVMPDYVFVADSKERVASFFDGVEEETKKTTLVADTFTHPKTLKKWQGDIYFYNTSPVEDCPLTQVLASEFTGDIGYILGGGSVSSLAFSFVVGVLRCDPIILVGQDCGYYTPDKHHASAITEKTEKFEIEDRVTTDILGKPIFTNDVLTTFCNWFEHMVTFSNLNAIFINATEGGILQKGWLIMPLVEVIKHYITKEIKK